MRQLTDLQRIKLLQNRDAATDPERLSVFGEILRDERLPVALNAFSCALTNSRWSAATASGIRSWLQHAKS
jgi:hypothetical protein